MPVSVELNIDACRNRLTHLLGIHKVQQTSFHQFLEVHANLPGYRGSQCILFRRHHPAMFGHVENRPHKRIVLFGVLAELALM